MKFNKIQRGNTKENNSEELLYKVLDAGFVCTIAVNGAEGIQIIPTSYGRKNDVLYFHGSQKNGILNAALQAEQLAISVHHLDGLVLAQTLFNTGVNYRSATVFGKAELIENEEEKTEALRIITEQVIPGRWDEVQLGSEEQFNATMVIKVKIESASVKMRQGAPKGDEELNKEVWSGEIPMKQIALPPKYDSKRLQFFDEDESVKYFYLKNKYND